MSRDGVYLDPLRTSARSAEQRVALRTFPGPAGGASPGAPEQEVKPCCGVGSQATKDSEL
jgi:hypothetical protein